METFKKYAVIALKFLALCIVTLLKELLEVLLNLPAFLIDLAESVFLSRGFRILIWLSYFISQNNYYGWHKHPQSEMELATDGIHVLLLMLAVWPNPKAPEVKVVINAKEGE